MAVKVFVFAVLFVAVGCQLIQSLKWGECSQCISSWKPLYSDESIYYGPHLSSGQAGGLKADAEIGVLCYIHGGTYPGCGNVWIKVCLPGTCCNIGYLPMYRLTCISGNCNVPYCSTDEQALFQKMIGRKYIIA